MIRMIQLALAGSMTLALGCQATSIGTTSDPYADYEDENAVVIGAEVDENGDPIYVGAASDETDCVPVSDNLCVPIDTEGSEWCTGNAEGGPIDIIMVDGEVAEVICYPPDSINDKPEVIVDAESSEDIDLLKNGSGTAITFDESTDGEPIVIDLNIEGNQVSIYGNGPENTIIDGDVTIDGNNVRLRGVTITGDLEISRNQTSVILCRVLGNVSITTNNTNNSVFVDNDVFGGFLCTSNQNLISGNDVGNTWEVTSDNNTCANNSAFVDDNGDEWVSADERTDLLECP